ncbi:MAG: ABC transporter permease [Rhizobiaceae bacterium]|nr:ABC transporter permease [Rhizobiaceae bacterium]
MSAGSSPVGQTPEPLSIVRFIPVWSFEAIFVPALILLLGIGMAFVEPRFLSSRNVTNILVQCSYLAVAASAQTIVMIGRGIDLSIGGAISLVSVTTALIATSQALSPIDPALGVVIAIAGGLLTASLVGALNGAAVAALRINPVITTLGTFYVCTGIAASLSDGRPVFNVPADFSYLLYDASIFGVKAPIVVAIVIGLLAHLFLNSTVSGRSLYIIGSNPRAGYVAGLPIRWRLALAYVISAAIAGCCAIMLTARTGSGEPSIGATLMLPSIAAAVIGGVSMRGGSGSIIQAFMGALLTTLISNSMNLLRVSGYMQDILMGVFVVLAVLVYSRKRR